MKRLAILLIALSIVLSVRAQQTVHPFECVPSIGPEKLAVDSIWLGYDNGGWDVGHDVRLIYRYNNEWIDTYRIYYSRLRDEYYLFVYDQLPADEGQGYLAWHPCGQGKITYVQYKQLRGGNE